MKIQLPIPKNLYQTSYYHRMGVLRLGLGQSLGLLPRESKDLKLISKGKTKIL